MRCLALDPAFVVEGGGDGFQFEGHLVEAGGTGGGFQGGLGGGVAAGVLVDEMHRPAHDHAARACAQHGFCTGAQLGQETGNDVAKGNRLAMHGGALVDERAAQQALERPHQPAFIARQVTLHGGAAERRAAVLVGEEQRGGQGGGAVFERQHAAAAIRQRHGHGRVGGAEVDADRGA